MKWMTKTLPAFAEPTRLRRSTAWQAAWFIDFESRRSRRSLRRRTTYSLFLLVLFLTSCGTFDDFEALNPPSDADTDADTDTDTDADTDTDTDTDADTDTDTDTCDPPPTCEDLSWDCGSGDDGCGNNLNCPDCPDAQWCDGHTCEPCDNNDHCGDLCVDCTNSTTTPYCSTDGSACVECMTDDDCREGDTAPFDSPLGICAPDGMCTCYVNPGDGKWQCTFSTDCPSTYYCARDITAGFHSVCLRECNPAVSPVDGITCESRQTAEATDELVWVPMTTCFAFDKFGVDCSGDGTICSVDGSGGLADGYCVDATDCSYPCSDDTWCPETATVCGTAVPYNDLCQP